MPHKGVHKEDVPTEGHQTVIHAVGVLKVDRRVLDVVAAVYKELTLSVEFNRLRWLVDTISSFEVLFGTLGQFSLSSVDDFVQVVDLAELALGVSANDSSLARS